MPYYVSSYRFERMSAHSVSAPTPFVGFGWNWFDHLGSGGLYAEDPTYRMDREVLPPLQDGPAWEALEAELDELRPGFIRYGLPPDPHTGPQGDLVTGTKHLERLKWLDRWAVQNDCTILIDLFTIPRWYEFPAPNPWPEGKSHCNMAARDNDDYARRFVAPLMRHLVVELNLKSVRAFNPVNEALQYGVYQTPAEGPDAFAHYVDMFRAMREALDEAGLTRDRVALVGCDCLAERDFFTYEFFARGLDIDPWVDAYSAHFYNMRFDKLLPGDGSWSSPTQDVLRRVESWQRLLRAKGKPLWVGEIGTFYYVWRENNPAGAASFDACLTVTEGILRLIGEGALAVAIWQLFDSNDNDGNWSALSLTDGGQWKREGAKHALYGALSRALRPNSSVWSLRAEPHTNLAAVFGLALVSREVGRQLVLTNNDPLHNWEVELELPVEFAGVEFVGSAVDRTSETRPMEPAVVDAEGTVRLVVPAYALVTLREARSS